MDARREDARRRKFGRGDRVDVSGLERVVRGIRPHSRAPERGEEDTDDLHIYVHGEDRDDGDDVILVEDHDEQADAEDDGDDEVRQGNPEEPTEAGRVRGHCARWIRVHLRTVWLDKSTYCLRH